MELKDTIFVGFVEDNKDPKKMGRCKVRIPTLFPSNIPTSDIPWAAPFKDLNGNQFNAPEVGKVVSVIFNNGDKYKPEFIYADHYNINLENKLNAISSDDYPTFKSIHLDQSTQIYRSKSEGLKLDHEYTNINLDANGSINLNLRDNNSKTNIGSPDASQAAVLGSAFMTWMDKLANIFISNTALIGNLGEPVVASSDLYNLFQEYLSDRDPKFLSKHVWVVDNNEVKSQTRPYINQQGDLWNSTLTNNTLSTLNNIPYTPVATPITGRPSINSNSVPSDITSTTIVSDASVKTVSVSNYQNGQIPLGNMKQNTNLAKNLDGDAAYLMADASDALDSMISEFNNSTFTGKQKLIFTDGYRTLARQQALYAKYGSGRAAVPGTSNHGWGIAIDMYWGVRTSMTNQIDIRPSAFKHPMYLWFLNNGSKYKWFNPIKLRDDNGTDEWWHWEYHSNPESTNIIAPRYQGAFTQTDITNIQNAGGTYT